MALTARKNTSEGILEMIDFFSQVMHPELIEEYGYRYIHDMLRLEASAIYRVKSPKCLTLAQYQNMEGLPATLAITEDHMRLATKIGVVCLEGLAPYLENHPAFGYADLLMPLTVADELIGFIVAQRPEDWKESDYTLAEAAKKMINLAFGTGMQMTENRRFRELMDRRIYDQMLIAQLSKLLLQHLDERELIQAAVEGIRELTASAQTAFFLKSPFDESLELVHYSDLIHFRRQAAQLQYKSGNELLQQCFSMETDLDILKTLFGTEGLETLRKLGAHKLVFLNGRGRQGFVTLGRRVSGEPLSEAVMPLVESILGSVVIGLENAKQFQELQRQKLALAESVQAMEGIALTLQNLSSSADLQEFGELLLMNLVFQLGAGAGVLYFKTAHDGYRKVADYGLSQLEALALSDMFLTPEGLNALGTGWLNGYAPNALERYMQVQSGEFNSLVEVNSFLMAGIWPRCIESAEAPDCVFVGMNLEKVFGHAERYYIEALLQGVAPLMALLK